MNPTRQQPADGEEGFLLIALVVAVFLVLLALMIPMFAFPSYWLDGAVMLAVVVCMGVIVMQVMALLEEPADAVTDFTGPDAPTRRA